MKPGSLTLRLSLLFVVAVAAVLIIVGVAFNELSRHHFRALDAQALGEKLEAITQIAKESGANPELLKARWHTLLGAHPDLSAVFLKTDGTPFLQNLPNQRCRRSRRPPSAMASGSGKKKAACSGP
uniref:Heavy metal sensor histidine kinase n=1 Tax=Pseudomonas syringae TaxID=317 RepID=I3W2M2_PSESX|nr:Heavy metal sensor histidine kinase [Pseudomonas syringae]